MMTMMTMTTNICTPEQYAAIEEMVKGIEVTCVHPHDWTPKNCQDCNGTGKIHPYASIEEWLEKHGKKVLYDGQQWESIEHSGIFITRYEPVLHVADALEVLEEAEIIFSYGFHDGIWAAVGTTTDETADTAAELLDKIISSISTSVEADILGEIHFIGDNGEELGTT